MLLQKVPKVAVVAVTWQNIGNCRGVLFGWCVYWSRYNIVVKIFGNRLSALSVFVGLDYLLSLIRSFIIDCKGWLASLHKLHMHYAPLCIESAPYFLIENRASSFSDSRRNWTAKISTVVSLYFTFPCSSSHWDQVLLLKFRRNRNLVILISQTRLRGNQRFKLDWAVVKQIKRAYAEI